MVTILLPTWRWASTAAAVFLAWTVTSFMCHQCAQMFLQVTQTHLAASSDHTDTEHRPFQRFCLALILTIVQCIECLLLVRPRKGRDVTYRRTTILLTSSHFLATLTTNFSMAYIEASSTLAIKFLEPLTMAAAHHVILQKKIPLQTIISMPFIICGSLIFSGHGLSPKLGFIGVSLALASNVILTARNVTLKKLQDRSCRKPEIIAKPHRLVIGTLLAQTGVVCGMCCLELLDLVPQHYTFVTGLCLTSGLFHVAYSYISTNIVLNVMNVVTHSIANIFKRLLVVLCLCMLGSRHITGINVLGLMLATLGLSIYAHGKLQAGVRQAVERTDKENNGRKSIQCDTLPKWCGVAFASFLTIGLLWGFAQLGMSTAVVRDMDGSVYREFHGFCPGEAPSKDFSHIYANERDPNLRDFLSWRLIDHPEDTDKRAKTLTTSLAVIEEAQRILLNLLQDLLGKAKHVMLIDIATYDNKGDPAITVGQVMLLRRLNIRIVYYCETYSCSHQTSLHKAADVDSKYAKDELVILMQGGGNLVGYVYVDGIRKKYIERFPDRKIIILSQSIFLHSKNQANLEYCRNLYSNRSNLVILLRDRQSYAIAKAHFQGVQIILAPDMAFGIGMVPRQLPPIHDIVWLKRNDMESPRKYIIPPIPPNMSVAVGDWLSWAANKPKIDLEKSFLIASAGFQFLQRGRIVVTDRLHGHILSTLMNIPHVLIDNVPHLKLSSFDRSWTASLRNTKLVSNGSLAFDAAMELLREYDNVLPSIGPKDMYAPSNG